MKHAAIVPLIGGMTLAAKDVLGVPPEFIVSWRAFDKNEQHLTNYLGPSVPRYLVDESGFTDSLKEQLANGDIDLVTALCPCAGLSRLNTSRNPLSAGAAAQQNRWMYDSAKIALGTIRPKVLIGENAPGLVQPKGAPTLENLKQIARDFGYSFSTVITNSLIHGLPQSRLRSFYIFWNTPTAPFIEYVDRNKVERVTYGQIVNEATGKTLTDVGVRSSMTASGFDPAYRFMLDLHGKKHREFISEFIPLDSHIATIEWVIENKLTDQCLEYIEKTWDSDVGRRKFSNLIRYAQMKVDNGMGYYFAGSYLVHPEGKHNTFAGKCVDNIVHPYEDRYLNTREMMCVMRLPTDMELLDWRKNIPCVPQSVPVTTARYFVNQIKSIIESPETVVFSNHGYVHQDLIRNKSFAKPIENILTEVFK